METVKHILGLSEFVEGVGNIYPVKVKDYDTFVKCSGVLNISKVNFEIKEIKEKLGDIKLLDLIFISMNNREEIKDIFQELFFLVLRKEVYFIIDKTKYGFIIDENSMIDSSNYDEVRKIIMKQNLIFEPKVYKNKLIQEWANKVLETRKRNSVKVTIEDMITTVSVEKGLEYEKIAEQTLYQLNADFRRIDKLKGHDRDVRLKCAGAKEIEVKHYAEWIDMFKSPYDDLFVKKEKMKDLEKAIEK